MENLTLLNEMKNRGLECQHVDMDEHSFMFTSELDNNEIIVEVYPKGIYHFYWTKKGMLGFLDSGMLENVHDIKQFDYNYCLFKLQVEQLKGNTIYGK